MTAIGHLLNHPAAGFVVRTLHLVEFLVLPGINLEKRLDVHPPTWSIRLQWLAALWAAINNAGMDSGRLESIELLQARMQDNITLVTIEGRTLGLPNDMQNSVTEDIWWVHISPRRLGAGDGTNLVLSQMRNTVSITLHLVEFLILHGIIFEHQLDVHSPDWNIRLHCPHCGQP